PGAGREAAAASGARSALRFALAGLRTVEGRKAVVLFSGNAALWEKPGGDSLTEAADRASAVVTLIDIRGASAAAAPTVGLAELAQHTGGRFATRTDDLAGALAGALRDQDGYYVVGYEPDQTPADGITGKPLPQHPVLTITRQGAQSRARNGLLNSDNFTSDPARSEAWRPSFTTPAADLGRGLSSPFVAGGIPVRLVAVYSLTKSGPQIEGVVHIDARDLTYTHWLDGRVTATLDVQLAAFDENGQSVQSGGGTYNLRLTPDEFKESLTRGFLAMPKLTIRAPGAYQVRVAVRDGTSGRIGSASELVNAADVSNGQLQITGLSLADESAATGNAAVNVFRPGQTFQYAYQIVNLALDANKGSEVDTRTRILHEGAPIFEGANTVLHFAPSEDPRVRTAGAGVKLGAALEPGYYVLEITVTDSLAKQPRTVREYVRFEVRG
ncbi:MAG TPA: hypothetical protein VGS58_21385, partial [Candidatus Sulfopaludibacter sp.]|nr:hypothetical protein [Candidatus Sulfopaludibacter sp.]